MPLPRKLSEGFVSINALVQLAPRLRMAASRRREGSGMAGAILRRPAVSGSLEGQHLDFYI